MIEHLEIKVAFDPIGDEGEITGIAWPFGKGPDRSGDQIERNAFVFPARLPMLWAHDPEQVVGVWNQIAENASGLQVKGRLLVNDVAKAREVRALVQAGAVTGLSIGYSVKNSTGRKGVDRKIQSLDLAEISLVSVPMHPGARVSSVKSASQFLEIADAINRATLAFTQQGSST